MTISKHSVCAVVLVCTSLLHVLSAFASDKISMIAGNCTEQSHVAEGPIGADLTERQSRFFCDSLVVSINLDNGNMMFQFGEKRSSINSPIAFAGGMDESNMLTVERVYLRPKEVSIPNDGVCKLFFKNDATEGSLEDLTGIMCAAQIDKDDRRIVPVIAFEISK